MDNAFDEENGPLASDIGYDEAMAKLNASLKRSSSVRGSTTSSRGSLEGPPHYIFGVSTSTKKEPSVFLQDVDVDDYDNASQLPSIEEARTTAASTLSRIERSHSSTRGQFPFDSDDDYGNDQFNKFLPGAGHSRDVNRDVNANLASQRKRNWYKIAFFIVIAAVFGTTLGLVVGFAAGEEVEKLSEEANNNNNGGVATTVPRPSAGFAPTSQPASTPTGSPPTTLPPTTPSPTAFRRIHNTMQWLVNAGVAKQVDFKTTESYQFQAAHWIADEDSTKLEIPSTIGDDKAYEFIERYVMALFYFSTKGKAWSYSFRFFSPEPVCKWNVDVTLPDRRAIQIGVVCDSEGRVVSLNLPQNNLVGTMVSELGLLTNLKFLALNHNVLGGTIPKEMGELTKLSYLAMHYNELKGEMPSFIGGFTDMRVLGLGDNRLTGSIPSTWSSLTQLRTLGLDNNLMTGDLSTLSSYTLLERAYLEENTFTQDLSTIQWSQLLSLEELDLSTNALFGTLPMELLSLPELRVLDLGNNQLTGILKDFTGNSGTSLQYFGVHGNAITGSIPTVLSSLFNLTHLDLSENSLVGFIPSEMQVLTNLQYLFLSDNENFVPSIIPSFLGELTNLRDLSLKGTKRVASISPTIFSKLSKLVLLELDNNELTGNVPTELGELTTLTYLLLNRNEIFGTMPTEIQLLPNLDIILLDKTDLTGNLNALCNERQRKPEISGADCHGDTPQIVCDCCNICCSDDAAVNATDCHDRVYFGQLDPVWENSYQRRYYQFADEDFGAPSTGNLADANDIGNGDQLGTGTGGSDIDADLQDNSTAVPNSGER